MKSTSKGIDDADAGIKLVPEGIDGEGGESGENRLRDETRLFENPASWRLSKS